MAARAARAKTRPAPAEFDCEGGCGRRLVDHGRRKTRLCKRCFTSALGRSEAKREKCREAMLVHLSDPEKREAMRTRLAKAQRAKLDSDPEFRAAWAERGRRVGSARLGINRPGAYPAGHPVRMAAGAKVSEARMRWCAPSYRAIYRELTGTKLVPAPEARAMVLEQFKHEAAAYAAGTLQDLETFQRVREGLKWSWDHG